jgi:hypothetical protein
MSKNYRWLRSLHVNAGYGMLGWVIALGSARHLLDLVTAAGKWCRSTFGSIASSLSNARGTPMAGRAFCDFR